ncbi:hypothetical protein OIU85_000023 [Salix viminalis]|uniref:Peptidase A1 domain-containing protein n=1 Tax=Salix viminalis TaxID=40686 RepID=A0A9Q0VJ42_SALVM|nr:hypothetical protein OIU85_000023 [Salix viminalis]
MSAQLSTKYGHAFSYCLPTANSGSSGGGFLSIGSISPNTLQVHPYAHRFKDSQLILSETDSYNCVWVPTLIDSGTVITRLPMSMYAALRQAFVKDHVHQGGADLTLRAPNILIEADQGITCLAFAGSSGSNQVAIIGNRQQQTYNIAYDVSTSRIGFAPGSCH